MRAPGARSDVPPGQAQLPTTSGSTFLGVADGSRHTVKTSTSTKLRERSSRTSSDVG